MRAAYTGRAQNHASGGSAMITRRRFIAIAAAMLALPGRAGAQTHRWQGQMMGADASMTLTGPGAAQALTRAEALLRKLEAIFSLYDPRSELSQLNAMGRCEQPSAEILAVLALSRELHHMTGGLFDPTVQPLWRALATSGDADRAAGLIGFNRVQVSPAGIVLDKGQALTFNGIAQGYATDRVRDLLADAGYHQCLINIGEYAALGGPWSIGIEDPDFGLLATRHVTDGAIATSSPRALLFADGSGHILDPARHRVPVWSSVSVQAERAALADGLSTALCFSSARDIRAVRNRLFGVGPIIVIDRQGDLTTL